MDSTGPSPAPAPPEPPKIHEAARAGGPSGAVLKGAEIDFATAVARRQTGLDIVVCGDDLKANRSLAQAIESAVGPATRPQAPHKTSAGPAALPHFQQVDRNHKGHSFYETDSPRRKARRNP
jgi:hypothetical protein